MIERDGGRLRVSGALTFDSIAAMADTGAQQFENGDIVDLSAVTEVDSAALSLIFEWQREAKRQNSRISFSHLPASLQSLAALYGVTDLIPVEDAPESSVNGKEALIDSFSKCSSP